MNPRSESGVMLIMVALFTFVLLGMSAFAIDLSDAWYARAQAQSAADAGALAGAVALAKDDITYPFPAGGVVEQSALALATHASNQIRGSAGAAVVEAACPGWMAAGSNVNCVRVSVYRDGTNGSSGFNTLFANLFGTTTQGVRATATAQVLRANAANCVRPYYLPDRFDDANNNGKVDAGEYTTASAYTSPRDIGTTVTFHEKEGPGSYGQIDVGNGNAGIRYALLHCAPNMTVKMAGTVPTTPGAKNGQKLALNELLYTVDPGASWNSTTKKVQGSCADAGTCNCGDSAPCPYNGTISPRILHAPVCDPAVCLGIKNGNITVTGILSFFITHFTEDKGQLDVHAVLIGSSGDINTSAPEAGAGRSFTHYLSLVQ